jgi:hypothetical protein
LFPPDRRTRDVDNYIKPLLDGLKFLELIQDDSFINTLLVLKHPKNLKYNKGLALVYIKEDVERSNRDDKILEYLADNGFSESEYMTRFHIETKRSDERYKRELKKLEGGDQ